MFFKILKKEMLLSVRQGSDLLVPVCFFGLVLTLFPFTLGAEPNLLRLIAPAIIWISLLLAGLLSLERLFLPDFQLGRLDFYRLTGLSTYEILLVKAITHWVVTFVPLLLLSNLATVFFDLSTDSWKILETTLLIGTPAISLIGCFGLSLSLGAKNGGILMALLILPFMLPILIFAASAISAVQQGFTATAQLSFLGAYVLFMAVLTPWAGGAALSKHLQ